MRKFKKTSRKSFDKFCTDFSVHLLLTKFLCYLDSIMNDINVFFKTVLKSMAIFFQIICFCIHNLFNKRLNTIKIVKCMLMAELAISTSMIAMSSASFVLYGWEKAIFYQFCMNQVSTILEITNNLLVKILRFVPSSVGQGLLIKEVFLPLDYLPCLET